MCKWIQFGGIGLLLMCLSCTPGLRERNKNIEDASDKRTSETLQLKKSLHGMPSRGFMFGHQDATVYGIGWDGDSGRSDVRSVTGDYPAVVGFDLGRIELGHESNLDNVSFHRMREEIIRHYERGGMVTVSWHADNPVTGGDSWDVEGEKVVASILAGGEQHELFVGWLETVANYFNSLVTPSGTKIPVLFRPWHEHTGSWFWWGKDHCTIEEYRELWMLTREVLDGKGVTNLLYAYSPDAQGPGDIYMERYPGDELVDLLGFDCYHRDNEEGIEAYQNSLHTILSFMAEEGKRRGKPIALTETGLETVAVNDWWTGVLLPVLDQYPVSYVLVWRNARERPNHYYASYPGHESEEDFVQFYEHPKTLFCQDIEEYDIYNP